MNGSWTWTTVRLTVGVMSSLGRRELREENWDNCNRIMLFFFNEARNKSLNIQMGQDHSVGKSSLFNK